MNGYSKISSGIIGTPHKSRSIDFSDLFSFPQTPKAISRKKNTAFTTTLPEEEEEPNKKQQQEEEIKNTKTTQNSSSSPETVRGDEVGKGERFGVILGRSGSVSSSSSTLSSGFQATMKRAFSLRRSSSVSERYCRIHDQYMATASPIGFGDEIDEEGEIETTRSMKKKQRGSKILKACKRILGL